MKPPEDTSPEAWEVFLDLQRRTPPSEKVRRVFDRAQTLRRLTEAGLRQRYPQAEEREIFLRRVRLELGPDLFGRVYGDVLPGERP